jgi:hypothetical protein
MDTSQDDTQQIHPDLKKNAQEIEASEIGTRVIGANYFGLDCQLLEMDLLVLEPKKFNILEEFILKAIQQFKPAPGPTELSQILGFDILFIDDALNNLLSRNIIQNDPVNTYLFTDHGLQYFKDGSYPKEKNETGVIFIYIVPLSTLIWIPEVADNLITGYEKNVLPVNGSGSVDISLEQTINALAENGANIHSPDIGYRVVNIMNIRQLGTGKLDYPAYLLLDELRFSKMVDDNLVVRLFNPLKKQRDFQLEGKFPSLTGDLNIGIKDIFPAVFESGDDDEVDFVDVDAQPEYKQAVLVQYKQEKEEEQKSIQNDVSKQTVVQQEKGTVEFLYAGEIRPRWLRTLREANHTATIISPWINDEVVDSEMLEDFKKLAQRSVLVNIGWGISKTPESEDRPIKQSLLNKLNRITTPDGLPAINVYWLGDTHDKDIIVDRRIHICGSHNYLSYRGDRHPRGESAYYVINQDTVKKALIIFDEIFYKSINRCWKEYASSSNQEGLMRCCVSWTCIYRPEKALLEIHNYLLGKELIIDPLSAGNLFKSVFKSLVQLPQDNSNNEIIYKIIKTLGMYNPSVVYYLNQNGKSIQEWIDYLCIAPLTKKIVMEQKKIFKRLDLIVPDQ